MPRRLLALLAAAAVISGCDAPPSPPASQSQLSQKWARADDPQRDKSRMTHLILEAVNPQPGMAVADIGAGAGYFSFKLATAVGATGHVYATDFDPEMIAYITRERDARGIKHLSPVQVDPKASYQAGLAPASVDAILMVNTFTYQPDSWLSSLIGGLIGPLRGARYTSKHLESCSRSLRPGGRLILFQDMSGEIEAGGPGQWTVPTRQVNAAQLVALAAKHFTVSSNLAITDFYDASKGQEPGYLIVFSLAPGP